MPVKPNPKETQDEFVSRCIAEEVSGGYPTDQAAAICYSYWDKENMSKIKDTQSKVMAKVAYNEKYKGIHLGQILPNGQYEFEDPCWPGYTQYGTKDMGGREVPNCIPDEGEE